MSARRAKLRSVITRRFEPSLTLVLALMVTAAVVTGHALSRLPSMHLGRGDADTDVYVELGIGLVIGTLAIAAWLADGARSSSGGVVVSRAIVVGLLLGAAVTGALALLTEAGNGCLAGCG